MSDHRWSGWPGAWCLDCGIPDGREVCLSGADCTTDVDAVPCSRHTDAPCDVPGRGYHDPYRRASEREARGTP